MKKKITGKTGLLCLLGSPVGHSFSPSMHNKAIEELGLDYVYLAFDVGQEDMAKTVETLKTLNVRGFNVTMPNKGVVCGLVNELSPAARLSGSCNTVVNDDGYLKGYTTDGIGFMEAVKHNDVNIIGETMTLLGTGGAATAILVEAALDGVKEINVFNRQGNSFNHVKEIANTLNKETKCHVTLNDYSDPSILRKSIRESKILVNATPLGMAPHLGECVIDDFTMFHKDLFVFDVIYNPEETKLLQEAKKQGLKAANGLDMLLYQGAASFKLWTDKDMPVDLIREMYFADKQI